MNHTVNYLTIFNNYKSLFFSTMINYDNNGTIQSVSINTFQILLLCIVSLYVSIINVYFLFIALLYIFIPK